MIHGVITDPGEFTDIISGRQTCLIRRSPQIQVGDRLELREAAFGTYMGRRVDLEVRHLLQRTTKHDLPPGLVVFSVRILEIVG